MFYILLLFHRKMYVNVCIYLVMMKYGKFESPPHPIFTEKNSLLNSQIRDIQQVLSDKTMK